MDKNEEITGILAGEFGIENQAEIDEELEKYEAELLKEKLDKELGTTLGNGLPAQVVVETVSKVLIPEEIEVEEKRALLVPA